MSTISKERAEQFANDPMMCVSDEVRELARIALASLEAEPIYQLWDEGYYDTQKETYDAVLNAVGTGVRGRIVYTAPPASVVPDVSAIELLATNLMKRIDKITGERHSLAMLSSLRVSIVEACRAAMLRGAEPVTTDYKLPFEQWLSQQTGTIDVECGCVMTEVFFHWLRVAYEAGNSPQCREISNSSTKNFRENAETSTKCWCHACRPVNFSDSRLVVCPECGKKRCPHANDHRNACTGSNEPGQEGSAYPAAPHQEVK